MTEKFEKVDPPIGPIGGVVGDFEILSFRNILLLMDNMEEFKF